MDRLYNDIPGGLLGGFKPKIAAAGGLSDGRGAAAAFVLGAKAVVMGTRFLASFEADIPKKYQQALVDARDGGLSTVRSHVFDSARGTIQWPSRYAPRGAITRTFSDFESGSVTEPDNYLRYQKALEEGNAEYGPNGLIDTFFGTSVGLVSKVMPAGDIVRKVVMETRKVLRADH